MWIVNKHVKRYLLSYVIRGLQIKMTYQSIHTYWENPKIIPNAGRAAGTLIHVSGIAVTLKDIWQFLTKLNLI